MSVMPIERDGQRILLSIVIAVTVHLVVIGLVETFRRPVDSAPPNESMEVTTFLVSSIVDEEPTEPAHSPSATEQSSPPPATRPDPSSTVNADGVGSVGAEIVTSDAVSDIAETTDPDTAETATAGTAKAETETETATETVEPATAKAETATGETSAGAATSVQSVSTENTSTETVAMSAPAGPTVQDTTNRTVDGSESQTRNFTQPRAPSSDAVSYAAPAIHPNRRYVAPEYPERARRAGIEGTVVLEVAIDRRGRPDPELIESSGSDVLDREAIRAVQLWRFDREYAGRRTVHRIEFTLEES